MYVLGPCQYIRRGHWPDSVEDDLSGLGFAPVRGAALTWWFQDSIESAGSSDLEAAPPWRGIFRVLWAVSAPPGRNSARGKRSHPLCPCQGRHRRLRR